LEDIFSKAGVAFWNKDFIFEENSPNEELFCSSSRSGVVVSGCTSVF
jgi:hypothetical protein